MSKKSLGIFLVVFGGPPKTRVARGHGPHIRRAEFQCKRTTNQLVKVAIKVKSQSSSWGFVKNRAP